MVQIKWWIDSFGFKKIYIINFFAIVIIQLFSGLTQAKEKRLLFFAIDGVALRTFEFAREHDLIPNLQGLMSPKNGGTFAIGESHPKGVTAAGWATHFYGSNYAHGWNSFDNETPESSINSTLPHLFSQILQADPESNVALFGASESGILRRVLKLADIEKNSPELWSRYDYARFEKSDKWVIESSLEAISLGKDTLSYILDIDNIGHEFGSESAEYLFAFMRADFDWGRLLRAASVSNYDWVFVAVTDHGFETSKVPVGFDAFLSVSQHGDDPSGRFIMTENSRLVFSIMNTSEGVSIEGSHNAEDTLGRALYLRTGQYPASSSQSNKKISRLGLDFPNRFDFIVDDWNSHPVSHFDLKRSKLILPTNLNDFKSRYLQNIKRSCGSVIL